VHRLAGLLHLATHEAPERRRISAETVSRAIVLGNYFTEHAKILYRVMAGRSGMPEARQVKEVILALPSPTTKRDIHRKLQDRAPFHLADSLNEPLRILEDYGWIRTERQGKSTSVTRNPPIENPDNADNSERGSGNGWASSALSGFSAAHKPLSQMNW